MNKNEEIKKLLEEGKSYRYISKKLSCSNRVIREVKEETIDKLEDKILKEIKKLNLNEDEVNKFIKQINKPEKVRNTYDHFYDSKNVRIGIIADTHIGSKDFDEKLFYDSIKIFDKEKVSGIYHCGDIIEGMSNREGHIYELNILGVSNQLKKASELLSLYKQPVHFITGNHDEWSNKKSNQGVIIGDLLESMIPNSKFLGEYFADINLADNIKMRLTHEGSSAYALSYSGQKRINAIQGGDKPDIICNGHIHKALYMFYRNIHFIEAGTFQGQTPFMRMKGSPSMKGFYVLDIGFNKKGVNEFVPKFYPGY